MTPELLISATGCLAADAEVFAKPLADVMAQYAIASPLRQAAFLAQMAHESMRFQRVEEDLYYSTAERLLKMWPTRFPRYEAALPYLHQPERLANFVYADRNGNGAEASGDGWRYRGRGLPQLTGRDNYAAFGADIGEPIVAHPDLVAQPPYACLAAGWLWKTIGGNTLADAMKFDTITRRINGPAMAGKEDRDRIFHRAYTALLQEKKA